MNTMAESPTEGADRAGLQVAVCATFVAGPVAEPLDCWLRELGVNASIAFAPYNQVFQQLLDASSLLARNHHGVNVLLVRLEDWLGKPTVSSTDDGPSLGPQEALQRNVRDFLAGVAVLRRRHAAPMIVILCPPSPSLSGSIGESNRLAEMEAMLAAELSRWKAVETVNSETFLSLYPLAAYHDPQGSRLADIPYTPPLYASLAMMIARKLHKLKLPQRKVIVLDCDNTLWNGIVGEDGCAGIRFDRYRSILQESILEQQRRGMLVALCSKNDESEVLQVLDTRSEMLLKRADLVGWRVNWKSKSENLTSLSRELGLSLDSFIFIDDDPVVCAEIRASLPEVLTLRLPPVASDLPAFLRHLWVFDRDTFTEEDRQRTKLYREHFMREQVRRDATSLTEFLASLQLEVTIAKVADGEAERVAELAMRTHQFNTASHRRTPLEIEQLQGAASTDCRVVYVKDRFGDYGLVGAIFARTDNDRLIIESFLLSCRALGRGVEHRVIAHCGLLAQQRGLQWVEIVCIPSPKNRPAVDFLQSLPGVGCTSFPDRRLFRLDAQAAASITYSPVELSRNDHDRVEEDDDTGRSRSDHTEIANLNMFLATVAESLRDGRSIHERFSHLRTRPAAVPVTVHPRTPVETAVAGIYCELLGVDEVGVDDGFFNLGGHSLTAMQVLSRLNAEFDVALTPMLLFTSKFTVAEIADAIVQQQLEKMNSEDISQMFQKLGELTEEQAENFTASGILDPPAPVRK